MSPYFQFKYFIITHVRTHPEVLDNLNLFDECVRREFKALSVDFLHELDENF